MTAPDLFIAWGPRGLLSLAGIVLVIAGVWNADRSWDEKGSAAYKKAEEKAKKGGASGGGEKAPLLGVEVPKEDLEAAFPFPTMFLLGWALFAASYFAPIDGSWEYVEPSWQVVAPAVVSMALGWIASVPMADAVMNRNASKKQTLGMLFVLSWLALTVLSGWGELTWVHFVLRLFGMVSIIASMKILWKFRKMGDTWEQEGRPNPDPVVYNMGGPLFVFGWFLFWCGMAASSENGDNSESLSGLPIFFTARTALAFVTGCGMVPVVMFLDYAHDHGAEFTGFGTDGRFFGRFLETPIPFLLCWTFFGLVSWLPWDGKITTLQIIILVNCVLQGVVAGVLIQTNLYKGNLSGKTKWSVPFVLLFLCLAIELGHGSWLRFGLAFPGAFLIVLGQKTVFGDRYKGDYWMETKEDNPNPIVYSYGEPFFMVGWILMSLVMSLEM